MGLNIKNEETYRLAAELAELTGDTMTGAITKALQAQLEAERRRRSIDDKVRRVMALVRASGPSHGAKSTDHDDLYDERGLPG